MLWMLKNLNPNLTPTRITSKPKNKIVDKWAQRHNNQQKPALPKAAFDLPENWLFRYVCG
jgi:hypothetical protein